MSVDRRHRDELAHVLAAHMRERPGSDELFAQLKRIHAELAAAAAASPDDADHTAIEVADEVMMRIECGNERLDTEVMWQWNRRRIALLLSDLSLPSATPGAGDIRSAGSREPPRTLARVLMVAMLLSLAAWPWVEWYAFAACWIISPAIWMVAAAMSQHDRRDESADPLDSAAPWSEHEALLANVDIPPAWDASPHYRGPVSRSLRTVSMWLTMALLVFAMYLFTASVWPVSIITMSFMRPDVEPRESHDSPKSHPHAAH